MVRRFNHFISAAETNAPYSFVWFSKYSDTLKKHKKRGNNKCMYVLNEGKLLGFEDILQRGTTCKCVQVLNLKLECIPRKNCFTQPNFGVRLYCN